MGFDVKDHRSVMYFPFAFAFAFEYGTTVYHLLAQVQVKAEALKLNGSHDLLNYTSDINLWGMNLNTVKKNKEAFLVTSKAVSLKVNAQKTKYEFMSHKEKCRTYLQLRDSQ